MAMKTQRQPRWMLRSAGSGVALCGCLGMLAAALGDDADDSRPPAAHVEAGLLIQLDLQIDRTGQRETVLKVFGDGRVQAGSPSGPGPFMEETIDPQQVARIAREVRETIRRSGLTTESLCEERRREAARTGLSAEIPGADETILSTAGSSGEIRCPALGVLIERYPDATRLQVFSALHDRLINIAAIVQAGGHAAAERLANEATRVLHEEHPGTRDWTIDDLSLVRARVDGSRLIQFRRKNDSPAQPGGTDWWLTNIIESPGQPLRVSVTPPESVVR